MKRYFTFLTLTFSFVLCQPLLAQSGRRIANYSRFAAATVEKYKKSGSLTWTTPMANDSDSVALSPYLYRLLGPGVYYPSAVNNRFLLHNQSNGRGEREAMLDAVDKVLSTTYAERPGLFNYSDAKINAESLVEPIAVVETKAEDLNPILQKVGEIKDVSEVVGDVDVDILVEKPNFWTKSGRFALQFTQNYFSEKWYRGGNNDMTLLTTLLLEAKYDDQKRLQWENKLDMRLGFVTAVSDSIHSYLTNDDKLLVSSKLNVKAAKEWFYAASAEGKTQFLPGRRANDRRTYSRFFAPVDASLSIGMDWKPKSKNGNTVSLALLPLSYKMRYICTKDENIHASYNMRNKDFQQDFGSRVEFNSKVTLVKNFTWRTRFYYFTSYEYAESELENLFSFQFNRYISTDLYTLWRFDDNRDKSRFYDHTLGFFQFKEYFTLGLSYKL